MINFTVGPVQADDSIRRIGGEQVPYFRTPEFSAVMKENERMFLDLLHAPEGSRAVFITGSGTASMEASIMNVLCEDDRAVVVDGGSFGRRFCELCELYSVDFERISPEFGRALTDDDLKPFEGARGFTAFVVNIHETSTGVLYDLDLISDFCRRNGLLLVVDAISSFLADPLDMGAAGIDVVIAGSQKALACPPGISLIALSPRALARVAAHPSKCMYLDLRSALANGDRGQTPFTPAVGVLLQINQRLREIEERGGVEAEITRTGLLAGDFRRRLAGLPFEITSESLSNAVTPLHPTTAGAKDVVETLKTDYGIWVTPSGGALAQTLLRVGHIGALTVDDNRTLVDALVDMRSRDLI